MLRRFSFTFIFTAPINGYGTNNKDTGLGQTNENNIFFYNNDCMYAQDRLRKYKIRNKKYCK